ncbi:MAG: NUDIX hydrolase [Emcibacter sp.]|nr:NUDIX hydrolase [Emcibacter sp.]
MKRHYPERPIVAVGVVIVKDDQILLIKRSKPPKPDSWSIPGGAQELGETIKETAIREVMEETAVTIDDLHFLDIIDYVDRDADNRIKHHYTLVDYAAEYCSGTLTAGDDAADAIWVPLDQISEYNLWSETVKIIYCAVKKLKNAKLTNET